MNVIMATSDVLKKFENLTSEHKSQNVRASARDFLFLIFTTKLLKRLGCTRYAITRNCNIANPLPPAPLPQVNIMRATIVIS